MSDREILRRVESLVTVVRERVNRAVAASVTGDKLRLTDDFDLWTATLFNLKAVQDDLEQVLGIEPYRKEDDYYAPQQ